MSFILDGFPVNISDFLRKSEPHFKVKEEDNGIITTEGIFGNHIFKDRISFKEWVDGLIDYIENQDTVKVEDEDDTVREVTADDFADMYDTDDVVCIDELKKYHNNEFSFYDVYYADGNIDTVKVKM